MKSHDGKISLAVGNTVLEKNVRFITDDKDKRDREI